MNFLRNFSFFIILSAQCLVQALPEGVTLKEIESNQIYKSTIALRKATKKGDVKGMKKCVQLGADVNDCVGFDWPHTGRMLLTEAIDCGSLEAVKFLLECGAVVEEPSTVPDKFNMLNPKPRGVPQLSYAIMVKASPEIIELLVRYSKNLDATDWFIGWTAYKIAAFYKDYEIMALLEKAGANTDSSIPTKPLAH